MIELGQLLADFIRKEIGAGRLSLRSSGGDGMVWVPGLNNGAMEVLLRQMAAAGLLSEKALHALGLNPEGERVG